jgi:neurexin
MSIDASVRCRSDTCMNGGTCMEQWTGPACDCDMTSHTGPTCSLGKSLPHFSETINFEKEFGNDKINGPFVESTSYDFGPGRGVLLFMYPTERRPDTRSDAVAFGFLTADPDAVLLRIDSAKTADYIEIELVRSIHLPQLTNGNCN